MSGMDFQEPNKIGTVLYVRYKNDRGGFLIEPDSSCVQKWDYIFFLVNMIIQN